MAIRFLCVYMKELVWLMQTSSRAAESLGATIEGNFLFSLTKPDVVLQEVQASTGNNHLRYSVKVLDPNTDAASTCRESKGSSGRCPPLLQYQETSSGRAEVTARNLLLQP